MDGEGGRLVTDDVSRRWAPIRLSVTLLLLWRLSDVGDRSWEADPRRRVRSPRRERIRDSVLRAIRHHDPSAGGVSLPRGDLCGLHVFRRSTDGDTADGWSSAAGRPGHVRDGRRWGRRRRALLGGGSAGAIGRPSIRAGPRELPRFERGPGVDDRDSGNDAHHRTGQRQAGLLFRSSWLRPLSVRSRARRRRQGVTREEGRPGWRRRSDNAWV
jgi:hypothetical protein